MTTAICTGSFDPITLGHTDVIRRAAACFDRVVICVAANTEKRNQLFTGEEKLALVQAAVADLPNVEAKLWPGLVVDFATGPPSSSGGPAAPRTSTRSTPWASSTASSCRGWTP